MFNSDDEKLLTLEEIQYLYFLDYGPLPLLKEQAHGCMPRQQRLFDKGEAAIAGTKDRPVVSITRKGRERLNAFRLGLEQGNPSLVCNNFWKALRRPQEFSLWTFDTLNLREGFTHWHFAEMPKATDLVGVGAFEPSFRWPGPRSTKTTEEVLDLLRDMPLHGPTSPRR
jgi:hypothetical protein